MDLCFEAGKTAATQMEKYDLIKYISIFMMSHQRR